MKKLVKKPKQVATLVSSLGALAVVVSGYGVSGLNNSAHGAGASHVSQVGAASTAGSKGTITIGWTADAEDVAVTYLWRDLLQQKGYKVNLTEVDAGPLFEGLYKNGINLDLDVWLPVTHKAYIQKYGKNYVNLGKWYGGQTEEGFVVPQYVTNVNSISDLEKNASEFKGTIVGIDPGAGETALAKQALTTYGLNNMTLQESSEAAMLTVLKKDYATKTPVVVTLWSPHWAFSAYKLKYLKDPKHVFGSAGWIQADANKTWASQNPTVVKWLKKFKISESDFGKLLTDINKNPNNPDSGVHTWMSANKSLVNSWFKS